MMRRPSDVRAVRRELRPSPSLHAPTIQVRWAGDRYQPLNPLAEGFALLVGKLDASHLGVIEGMGFRCEVRP